VGDRGHAHGDGEETNSEVIRSAGRVGESVSTPPLDLPCRRRRRQGEVIARLLRQREVAADEPGHLIGRAIIPDGGRATGGCECKK